MCDRALVRHERPLRLVAPSETFEEFMEFEESVEMLEPLLFVLRRFVEQLAHRLGAVYLVAQELRRAEANVRRPCAAVVEMRETAPRCCTAPS